MGKAAEELVGDDDEGKRKVAQAAGDKYGVYNSQTGGLISAHTSRESAARAAHKIFLENGGHVHVPVRRIPLGPAPKG